MVEISGRWIGRMGLRVEREYVKYSFRINCMSSGVLCNLNTRIGNGNLDKLEERYCVPGWSYNGERVFLDLYRARFSGR